MDPLAFGHWAASLTSRRVQDQVEALLRGVEQAITEGELRERIAEGRPLRVKLGLDPTAPKVTLGWAVVLRQLRRFQEFGHVAVLIVGDFTARVGDPSGMSQTRPRLSTDEIRDHSEPLLEGFRRILLPEPLEIRYNSEWLAGLEMEAILELTSKMTVAQLLERDDFRRRFEAGQPISLMEFLYPLLQAMDSVAVEADVELGGADQLWNLMTGRDIQQRYGMRAQIVVTMPLLVGTDGSQKMSQSLGNYIAIDDEPADMFGKVMSLPDEAMSDYFRLTTDLDHSELEEILVGLEAQEVHPGEAKRRLGREIVTTYWSREAAEDAEASFDRVHKSHLPPTEVREHRLGPAPSFYLPIILKEAGLVPSSTEGRRMITQGAVRIDGVKLADPEQELARRDLIGKVLQVGRRRFVRLID